MRKITVGCLLVGVGWAVAAGCDDFGDLDLGTGGSANVDAGDEGGSSNAGSGNGNAGEDNGGSSNNGGSNNNGGNGGNGGDAGEGGSSSMPDTDAGGCHSVLDCNDIDGCTTDSCVDHVCVHVPVSFDDQNICTADSCSSVTGDITHVPIVDRDNDKCTLEDCTSDSGVSDGGTLDPDDGNACTVDTCDPQRGVVNSPVDVDDGFGCTADSCDPATGIISHVPGGVPSDGDPCTLDYCDLTGEHHDPTVPDDGDGCTTDSCTSPGPEVHTFCGSGICDVTTENCLTISATSTFTQSTPTAVPTGPAVVTSTLVVSGIGTILRDVNLTTNLTHTFGADLDITLQSPAGTVITLTTDNGAGNDNTFNGTFWDDDANSAGQVPYVTNNGVASEHAYVNLTAATPLAPEEALAAFMGEDPNGTWTITISDDLAGDGGSLDSWSLGIQTISAAPTVTGSIYTQSTPVAIVDLDVVTSTISVPDVPANGNQVCSITLTTNITHTSAADIDMTLTSPSGTVVTLTTDNGAGNDNVFNGTVWDDQANPGGQVPYTTNNGLATDHAYVDLTTATPLAPEEPLAAFIGENPTGNWILTVSDDLGGETGSIDSWSINVGRCIDTTP